jgi:two-component system sporulation sensor kinase C
MKIRNNRLPSLKLVLIVGMMVVVLEQSVLFLLQCGWLMHMWGFLVTSSIFGAFGWMYRHIIGIVKQSEDSLKEMVLRWGELEQTDKLTMAGTLAAGIAHEIRNPLTSLRGFIQLLQPKEKMYTNIMLSEVDRINEIVNEMLELAKPKESLFEPNEHQNLYMYLSGICL